MRQADICHARTCNTHDDTVPSQNGMHKLRYARGRNRATEFCSELNTARTHTPNTMYPRSGEVVGVRALPGRAARVSIQEHTNILEMTIQNRLSSSTNQIMRAICIFIFTTQVSECILCIYAGVHVRCAYICIVCLFLCSFTFSRRNPKCCMCARFFLCVLCCVRQQRLIRFHGFLWFCLDYRVYCAYTAFVVRQNKNASDDFEKPVEGLSSPSAEQRRDTETDEAYDLLESRCMRVWALFDIIPSTSVFVCVCVDIMLGSNTHRYRGPSVCLSARLRHIEVPTIQAIYANARHIPHKHLTTAFTRMDRGSRRTE